MSGIYQYMLISPYDKIDNLNQRLEKHKHRKQADQIATILRENPILGFKHSTLSHQHRYNNANGHKNLAPRAQATFISTQH